MCVCVYMCICMCGMYTYVLYPPLRILVHIKIAFYFSLYNALLKTILLNITHVNTMKLKEYIVI